MEEYDDIYRMCQDEPWRRCPIENKIREEYLEKNHKSQVEEEEKLLESKGLRSCPMCSMPYEIGKRSNCGHREELLKKI